MVPSSNRLGNGPLKAEIGVRTSMESPATPSSRKDEGILRANEEYTKTLIYWRISKPKV